MIFKLLLLIGTLSVSSCKKDDYSLNNDSLKNKKEIVTNSRYYSYYINEEKDLSRLIITPKSDSTNTIFISAPFKDFIKSYKKNIFSQAGYGSIQVHENEKELFCDKSIMKNIKKLSGGVAMQLSLSGKNCPSEVKVEIKFKELSAARLKFDIELSAGKELDAIIMHYATDKGESFFGLGEQFGYYDFKGKNLPILVVEQGQGRNRPDLSVWPLQVRGDWFTTYAPTPQYITKNYHGLFLYNNEYSEFNFEKDSRPSIKVWSNRISGEINWSTSYKGLIDEYTKATGRPLHLADWVHKGAVVGTMGGSEFVRSLHTKLKKRDAALSSYWLQDWVGTRVVSNRKRLVWVWKGDNTLYPNWDKLRKDMKNDGLKMMGYFNTFMIDPRKLPPPVSEEEKILHEARVKYFQQALDNDFLIKRNNGQLYYFDSGDFKAHLLDLTNKKAVAWFKDNMKREIIKYGFKGWMADFGEALPFDAKLNSGISGEQYHNVYPVEWAKLNREIAQELGLDKEAVIFHRSAFRGSQKYVNLFWAGDQTTTWDEYDGFKSSIVGILNGGLSGMAINHSDIGGYTNFLSTDLRSDELQARWIEANAFSPILRTHEGLTPEDNAQIYSSEFNLEFFAYFSKVYASLWDYRKTVFKEASESGVPAMRHMMLEFPNDPKVYETKRYQYLLGADLLVAPVVEPGKDKRRLYLPGDNVEWTHFWSGRKYISGEEITIASEIGQIPVFFRSENKLLEKASLESRRIIKRYLGKNKKYPICLPNYSFKKLGNQRIECKSID